MSHSGFNSSLAISSKEESRLPSAKALARGIADWTSICSRYTLDEEGQYTTVFNFDKAITRIERYPQLYNLKLTVFRKAIACKDLALVKRCREEWGVIPMDLSKHGYSPIFGNFFGTLKDDDLALEWIKAACDDESLSEYESDQKNALHFALSYRAPLRCVQYLLERYSELYVGRDAGGRVPLHFARGKNLVLLCQDLRAKDFINDPITETCLIFHAIMDMDFRTASLAYLRDALNALQAVLDVPGVRLDVRYCGRNPYEFLKNEMIWRYAGYPWRAEQADEQALMVDFNKVLTYLEKHMPHPRASMMSVSTVTSSATVVTEESGTTAMTPTQAHRASVSKRSEVFSLSLPFGGRLVRARRGLGKSIDNSEDAVLPTSRSA